MTKENVVHLHSEILLSHAKQNIMNFAGKWMELENTILSEVTQSQKDMDGMSSFIFFSHFLLDIFFIYVSNFKCYPESALYPRPRHAPLPTHYKWILAIKYRYHATLHRPKEAKQEKKTQVGKPKSHLEGGIQ